ncbi:MAG: hypothetical protein ABI878_14285 [Acidobacteriota bacterium]
MAFFGGFAALREIKRLYYAKPAGTIALISSTVAVASAAFAFAYLPSLQSSAAPSDLAYFQGKWTITLKADPTAVYTWTVTDDLKGEWLTGVVEKGGERTSTDHWRISAGLIERYVFTNEGVTVKLVSSGWKSGKMVFNGIASGKATDSRMRETITRETDRKFRAVWEKQAEDGKWVVFSEESCVK